MLVFMGLTVLYWTVAADWSALKRDWCTRLSALECDWCTTLALDILEVLHYVAPCWHACIYVF